MNKIIRKKDFLLAQPLRTRKQYTLGKIAVLITGISCITIIILTIYYWDLLAWYFKLTLAFFVFLLSPDIESIKFIMKDYDIYREGWAHRNSDKIIP